MWNIFDFILRDLSDDLELYVILNDIDVDTKKELELINELFFNHLRKYYKGYNDYKLISDFDFYLNEYCIEKYNFKTKALNSYKELKTIKYFNLDKKDWGDIDYVKYYLNENFCEKNILEDLSWFSINSYYSELEKEQISFYQLENYKEYPYNLIINLYDFDLWVNDNGGISNLTKKCKENIRINNLHIKNLNKKYYNK